MSAANSLDFDPQEFPLARILGRVSVREFIDGHFGEKPLHLPGAALPLCRFIGMDRVRQWLGDTRGRDWERGLQVTVRQRGRSGFDVAPAEVERLLALGVGAVLRGTHHVARDIDGLTKLWLKDLGLAGTYACVHVLSQPGTSTDRPHFDRYHGFTIQVEGKKEWKVSSRTAERATQQEVLLYANGMSYRSSNHEWENHYGPYDPGEMQTFVLSPGDVLYVPPGCWHAVHTVGEELSVSALFAVTGRTAADSMHAALEKTLLAKAAWREMPARGATEGDGTIGDDLRSYFREMLGDLGALVGELEKDPSLLFDELQAMKGAPQRFVNRGAISFGRSGRIEPDSELSCVQHPCPVATRVDADGDRTMTVFHERGRFTCAEERLLEFTQKLVATPRFRARDAMGWTTTGEPLEWDRVHGALGALVDVGFLEVVSRGLAAHPRTKAVESLCVARSVELDPREFPLSRLLGRTTMGEFIAGYFGERPLHLPGAATPLCPFLGMDRVRHWLADLDGREDIRGVKIRARLPGKSGFNIAAGEVERLLGLGAGVVLGETNRAAPDVAGLAKRWLKDLGLAGKYGCAHILSQPRTSTEEPHFDAGHNFTVQIEGKKEWKVSPRPAEKATQQQVILLSDGTVRQCSNHEWEANYRPYDPAEVLTYVLEPGDVLYIPPGCWHAVHTVGEELSVSAVFSLHGRTVADLIRPALESTLLAKPTWREVPPRGATEGADTIDDGLRRYFQEVLGDLRAFVERLQQDPSLLFDELQALKGAPITCPIVDKASPVGKARVERDSELVCVQSPCPVARHVDAGGNKVLSIFHERGRFTCTDERFMEFAERLVTTRRFRARDASSWTTHDAPLGWDQVREVLTALVDVDFLEVAPEARPAAAG